MAPAQSPTMPVRQPLLLAAAATTLVLGAAALMARPAPASNDVVTRTKEVCASKDVALQGEAHRLLAHCTRSARETNPNTPGRIDLQLLKRQADGWQVVAQQIGIESGQLGQPGEVAVLQLGTNLYGFELSETSVTQGYLLGGTRLYVPRETSFQLALDITSSVRNTGTHECAHATPATCNDFSRRLKVEPRDGAAAYTLRITSLGQFRGQPVSATHVLNFDAKRHQYRLPAGFEAQVE